MQRGILYFQWMIPSPTAADKFVKIYQDLMMDRNLLSGMGPLTIRAVNMILLIYWSHNTHSKISNTFLLFA